MQKLIMYLQELEKVGILRDDPRLTLLIQTLQAVKKKTFSAVYGIYLYIQG